LTVSGRVAAIGIIAAVLGSAAGATSIKLEDARELADQTAPWCIYFAVLLICALLAVAGAVGVWEFFDFAMDKRRGRGSND